MDKSRQTYKDARKKLREVQKSRGFYPGDRGDRSASIQQEKQRSRCAACSRIRHWAGGRSVLGLRHKLVQRRVLGRRARDLEKARRDRRRDMFFSIQDEDEDLWSPVRRQRMIVAWNKMMGDLSWMIVGSQLFRGVGQDQ